MPNIENAEQAKQLFLHEQVKVIELRFKPFDQPEKDKVQGYGICTKYGQMLCVITVEGTVYSPANYLDGFGERNDIDSDEGYQFFKKP